MFPDPAPGHEDWRPSHPRKLRSRQGYAFSALFPELRDLLTMKGWLDLERQGYGFERQSYALKHTGCFWKHKVAATANLWG